VLSKSLNTQRDISLQVGTCIEELLRITLAHEFFPAHRSAPTDAQKRSAPDGEAQPPSQSARKPRRSRPAATKPSPKIIVLETTDDVTTRV
jgi:hypothetical protein